jgi:hypothetical protein
MQFLSRSYPAIESSIVTGTAATSITVSIISAVMTYLKLGEFKTKHEISQVAWQNFYNIVKHELSLARDLREESTEFLQKIKAMRDRLFEISPICNHGFIRAIKKKVLKNNSPGFCIPSYMNGWHHTPVFRDEEFEDNSDDEKEV